MNDLKRLALICASILAGSCSARMIENDDRRPLQHSPRAVPPSIESYVHRHVDDGGNRDPDQPGESLSLAQATSLTLRAHPQLAAYERRVRAREAAELQAGAWSNPELAVEIENVGGTGDLSGFNGAETTIAISQWFELGGKRPQRRSLASLERNIAELDYAAAKIDVLCAMTKSFIDVLVAQEQVELNEELAELARKTHFAVQARVDAGKVSPLEATRTEVERASAQSDAFQARRRLDSARTRLRSFWGAESRDFGRVAGDLTRVGTVPAIEGLQHLLDENPNLTRWGRELDRRRVSLTLAHSQVIPDIRVSAGVRRDHESGRDAYVIGVGVPIPLWNRNRGAIQQANWKLEQTQFERDAERNRVYAEFIETWEGLESAFLRLTTLRDRILPAARKAQRGTELGYREGKLDVLEMVDAQRTLFTAKRQYLEALGEYHSLKTDIEGMLGASLDRLDAAVEKADRNEGRTSNHEK